MRTFKTIGSEVSADSVLGIISDPFGAAVLREPSESNVSRCARPGDGELRVFATANAASTGIAGTYVAENGERLTFVMLAEDPGRLTVPDDAEEGTEPVGPYEFCNPLQAAMLDAITGHPYGPDLADLSPFAPTES